MLAIPEIRAAWYTQKISPDSFESAFNRSLAIGRAAEQECFNGAGMLAQWRLKEVVTLALVDVEELDGVEVHHQFASLNDDERYGFDLVFQPQPHNLTQLFS